MKVAWLLCCSLGIGCDYEETYSNPEVALADLNAELDIRTDATTVVVYVRANGCPALKANATAMFDGIRGDVVRGGRVTIGSTDGGHGYHECELPRFSWPIGALRNTVPRLEISDRETTWTMTIDSPGVTRAFQLVDAAPLYRAGDVLSLELVPGGSVYSAEVEALAGTTLLFKLNTMSGITLDGVRIGFTMPSIAEIRGPTAVTLEPYGQAAARILSCDAPAGCIAEPRPVTGSLNITIAP